MKINISKYPQGNRRRKIKIQIDKWDTYSMDHTLAMIIYPMLLQLKATKHGVPSEFVEVGGEDYHEQDSFDFYKESHQEYFDKACERWDEILDKMIWSFQQIAEDNYDNKYHHGEPKYDWVKSDKQYHNPISGKLEDTYQMVDKNPNEHWYDSVGHTEHEKRIREGLELFGKYYQNLWD